MELQFLKPKTEQKKPKLYLRKDGIIGLSSPASRLLDSNRFRYIKIGISDAGKIYIAVQQEEDSECFKLNKAGSYYFLKKDLELIKSLGAKLGDRVVWLFGETEDGFTELIRL